MYEDRFVAFVDVLRFKNEIEKNLLILLEMKTQIRHLDKFLSGFKLKD